MLEHQEFRLRWWLILIFWSTNIGCGLAQGVTSRTAEFKIHTNDTLSQEFIHRVNHKISKQVERGFLECSLGTIRVKESSTLVQLIKGPRYIIANMAVTNPIGDTLKIFAPLRTPYFSARRYQTFLDQTLAEYTNSGYPNAVVLNKTNYTDHHIFFHFVVDKGAYFEFDSVKAMPKSICRSTYLMGLTGIRPQKPFSNKQVEQSVSMINQTGFLKCDSIDLQFNDRNKAQLTWFLHEVPMNYFDGFIGIQQSKQNTTTVTGQVNLQLINSLKHGESVLLEWQKTAPNSQYLNLQMAWPQISTWALGADGSLTIDRRDSLYTNTNYKIGLTTNWHQNHSVGLYFSNYASTAEVDTSTVNTSSQLFEVELKRLDFNLLNSLQSGYFYKVAAGFGVREANFADTLNESLNISKVEVQMAVQQKYKSMAGVIKMNSGIINSSHLLSSELFKIGGINSFRGLNDRSVFCKSYLFFNSEYRLSYASHSFALLFFDAGWFNIPLTGSWETKFISAIGIGTVINTKAGVIKLNYAVAGTHDEPFNVSNAKIHIGYSLLF